MVKRRQNESLVRCGPSPRAGKDRRIPSPSPGRRSASTATECDRFLFPHYTERTCTYARTNKQERRRSGWCSPGTALSQDPDKSCYGRAFPGALRAALLLDQTPRTTEQVFFLFFSRERYRSRAGGQTGRKKSKRSVQNVDSVNKPAAAASARGVITATGALPPLNAAALGIMRGRPKSSPSPPLPHVLPSSQPPQLNVCPPPPFAGRGCGGGGSSSSGCRRRLPLCFFRQAITQQRAAALRS